MVNVTAKTCKRGHVDKYDKFRKCTECNRIDNLARYYEKRTEIIAHAKTQRAANPEKHRTRDRTNYAANKVTILANAKRRHAADPARMLFVQARARAKKQGCPFTISKHDVRVPTLCPLLGIELKIGSRKVGPASPTLDKIIPALGYVLGNIAVISHRANAIKNNASLKELQTIVKNWERRAWDATGLESGTVSVRAEALAKTV